ncbi:hypothetical protein [Sphingomonas immobilis]|uniref:Uncharacterized protein n=1 Tax=Sphingomonas immobilis TaxID=3063997 RepID=A0ABT8ZU60_9SPHN|nr:hypothetical protein [Sphingomonas sp. CA1-15]MDO7841107.1 hypothetical protein [Sphingomonas sp. CA1-15]
MIALALLLAAGTADINKTVQLDGEGYRVETEGEEVRVIPKRALKALTLARRDNMRVAVKAATGCKIEDEFFTGGGNGYMVGRLICAPSH